jgi:predicted cobalt transporter CbtA
VVFRTISTALLAGVVAGFCLFVMQRSSTLLLIYTAETYEKTASVAAPPDAFAKEPMRSVATLLGDVFLAIAFGLLLTGFYAFSGIDGWLPGLLCGLVGFASFHLAPAMIVPPAVPGMEVAALALRQIAWSVAAVSAIIGFILLFSLTGPAKLVGVLFFVLPTGIFRVAFSLRTPTTRFNSLALIDRAFVTRTLVGMLVFWLILGALSGYLFARSHRNLEPMRAVES